MVDRISSNTGRKSGTLTTAAPESPEMQVQGEFFLYVSGDYDGTVEALVAGPDRNFVQYSPSIVGAKSFKVTGPKLGRYFKLHATITSGTVSWEVVQ